MIFVTVGSTDFDALIQTMDDLAPALDEPVVMQIGGGSHVPQHAAGHVRYAPSLQPYIQQADLVVSHGGLGTVLEVLAAGKRLVAVSNPDRYDSHQDDLLGEMEREGHLTWCRDLSHLEADIRAARARAPIPYVPPPCTIHVEIASFLRQRFGS